VRLAQLSYELVDLDGPVRPGRELAHLREAACGDPIVLGACFGQLVLDKAGENREDGERVDVLVCLREVAPGPAVIESKRTGEVPRELDVLERQ
jgi:hypothetical protein